MLREAELFVMAEEMLVEVLGRVRPEHHDIVLPPMFPGVDRPTPIIAAIEGYLAADTRARRDLEATCRGAAGVTTHEQRGGPGPAVVADMAEVAAAAWLACAAAREVDDPAAVVSSGTGEVPVRDYLLQMTVERSLLAHYVAAYLGSTACPLPEELARPLWELTAPDAADWRELGHFREPMPLPDHVSWRDRFLLTAGHLPHPLGH